MVENVYGASNNNDENSQKFLSLISIALQPTNPSYEWCKTKNGSLICAGWTVWHPLSFHYLGASDTWGWDLTFDHLEESTIISAEAHISYFHVFIQGKHTEKSGCSCTYHIYRMHMRIHMNFNQQDSLVLLALLMQLILQSIIRIRNNQGKKSISIRYHSSNLLLFALIHNNMEEL